MRSAESMGARFVHQLSDAVLDAGLGHHEAEDGHLLPLRVRHRCERAIMDRVDELTRVLQTAAVPGAVRAAHPTRVHLGRRTSGRALRTTVYGEVPLPPESLAGPRM